MPSKQKSRPPPPRTDVVLFDALMQIEARLIRIEDKLDAMERKAHANGQQAATWTTPKSWAAAQKRPPQVGDG